MDGITDCAYRRIVDEVATPSVLFTEFTNVEGLARNPTRLLDAFLYHKTTTPTVAQIFGSTPEDFYTATLMVCAMGFSGVDINMGCPDKNVSKHGAGAALIRTPRLAQRIVKAVRQATIDFAEGADLKPLLPPDALQFIEGFLAREHIQVKRVRIPVSVKTRIGYDSVVTKEWIRVLTEVKPDLITVHGRTLKQLYSGVSNWEEIGKAAAIAHENGIVVLGSGDVQSLEDAKKRIATYSTDGALIGRATFGNPWIFSGYTPPLKEKLETALKHTRYYTQMLPNHPFIAMRKHLSWYTRGFEGASEVRMELMRASTLADVERVLTPLIAPYSAAL